MRKCVIASINGVISAMRTFKKGNQIEEEDNKKTKAKINDQQQKNDQKYDKTKREEQA